MKYTRCYWRSKVRSKLLVWCGDKKSGWAHGNWQILNSGLELHTKHSSTRKLASVLMQITLVSLLTFAVTVWWEGELEVCLSFQLQSLHFHRQVCHPHGPSRTFLIPQFLTCTSSSLDSRKATWTLMPREMLGFPVCLSPAGRVWHAHDLGSVALSQDFLPTGAAPCILIL